jgi:hypothetical protein
MIYWLLAHLTILLHLSWIIFLIFGIILVMRMPRLAYIHLAGLLFTIFLNLTGWYCPLTYLENYLHLLSGSGARYTGGFIYSHLERIIYPDLPEVYIRVLSISFVTAYAVLYVRLAKRYRTLDRLKSR